MFYGESHGKPHIHAEYGDEIASFAIETGEMIKGKIPRKKKRMVREWIGIHKNELMAGWQMVSSGKTPPKIKPLR